MPYFHGSFTALALGLLLRPDPLSTAREEHLDALIEACRPAGLIARHEAVYLTADADDIDAVGGYTEHVYEVEPEGAVEKSDLAWYSQAQIHLEDGDLDAARACAWAYWSGQPFHDAEQSVFEYRVRAATVRRDLDAAPARAFR